MLESTDQDLSSGEDEVMTRLLRYTGAETSKDAFWMLGAWKK